MSGTSEPGCFPLERAWSWGIFVVVVVVAVELSTWIAALAE